MQIFVHCVDAISIFLINELFFCSVQKFEKLNNLGNVKPASQTLKFFSEISVWDAG